MVFVKPDNWNDAHFFYICYNVGSVNNSHTAIIYAESRSGLLKTVIENKWAVTCFLEITENEYNELMDGNV